MVQFAISILALLIACCALSSVYAQSMSSDHHSEKNIGESYAHINSNGQTQQQQHQTQHYSGEARKTYNKISPDKKGDELLTPASVLNRLDWRSLFTTAMKMFFGNGDEQSKQASRQLVNMIISLIDGLRLSFTMKRAQARSSGGEEAPTTDAALAGLSMLKAYVKTITSGDSHCIKKYMCQANREAVKDGNKIGYMIAQFGSYATSYMLENFRYSPFDENFNAGKDGRNGVNCEEIFSQCNELRPM